jgi:predicted Zn-dependent protease
MIVEQIIQKAMEKADAAQAVMTTQETSAVDFENDKLKSAESSQRTNINVKVIKDGKVGYIQHHRPGGHRRRGGTRARSRRVWEQGEFRNARSRRTEPGQDL